MRVASLILGAVLSMLLAAGAAAQSHPYTEGTVWDISYIRVKPGMMDVYLRDLATTRKKMMDQAKKEGLIISEKILSGSAMGRDDYNLMLMVEYKNYAALDGLSAKFDALLSQVIGSEEKQTQAMVKRAEVREIIGDREFQELTLK